MCFFTSCLDRAVGLGSEGGGVSCMHRRLFEPIVGPFFLVFFLLEFYVILLGHKKDKRGKASGQSQDFEASTGLVGSAFAD